MKQSLQDDLFEDMANCITNTQCRLVLAALNRRRNDDELQILTQNSAVARHLGGTWSITEIERRLNG
jgi:hypothetical protein